MADVWKIAQKISAEDMYKNPLLRITQNEDGGVKTVNLGIMFGGDDVTKVNNLTAMCEQMSSDYERIVDDNNAYVDLFSFGTAPSSGVDYNKICEILSSKLGYSVCYALQRTGFGDLQTRLVLGVSKDTFRKEFLKPLVI